MARAVVGYFAVPLGEITPFAKYGHNVGFLVGSILLGSWAAGRSELRTAPEFTPGRTG